MAGQLGRKLAAKFDEEIRFFKGWIDGPKAVGAILPTSSVTARRMASVIDTGSGLPVLELGPGTGVITKAILKQGVKPADLYSIEYSQDFVDHLNVIFPEVNIIQGDAFDLDSALGEKKDQKFDCIISAVPMLNFPMDRRIQLVESLLSRIPRGRPLMQITYGPLPPVPAGRGNYTVQHYDFVVRNVPPAQLWVYRSPLV
ncbi:SAM-dependent methyltransferase [Ochrobactrum sp. 695/2009]|nr:class I SAM-dependent methyltransferase [Brucella intermedia]PJR90803.1 SAM-dependent methyltransferase [Ochrobactrum sp. 721/2009]PJT15911.1 SAM-dependent methyltransferase [Ochrobactrum sp. 720/2009]PJT25731.1 SAM-dependent methyltransferase [Ochrobactrum sp. 715/2009]PJT29337.1 SAM-dependent methyltransferase [Ochrobactrum sp. 695/2009]PJT35252.1 SAM-dependent methyltransferase [Ochrobactrum sp. 689/2009]